MNTKTNIKNIREAIASLAQKERDARSPLGHELDYFCDVQTDADDFTKLDLVDAAFQVETFAENNGDRKMLALVRRLLVSAGFYREMSVDEIERTSVTRGSVWDFKLGGVPYTHVASVSVFA